MRPTSLGILTSSTAHRSGVLRVRPLAAAVVLIVPLLTVATSSTSAEAALAEGFSITAASAVDAAGVPAVAAQLAGVLLGQGVALSGTPTINGGDLFDDPAVGITAFGTFSGGATDVGIASGVIIGANASFRTDAVSEQLDNDRDDEELAELLRVAGLPGSCAAGSFNAEECVNNATSLEFSVVPTDRYLKFEFVLGITEFGSYDEASSTWSAGSDIFTFPDGFGLFVGGRTPADNCAVIPTTTTYVSMQTAGVVSPLEGRASGKAAALANLSALVADPGSAPTPPGLAYAAKDADDTWAFRFLTVPLTCVVDLGATLPASVPIKIVIADANDSAVPPAVFLAGGSVRFSSTDTPSTDDAGGVTNTPVTDSAPGPSGPQPVLGSDGSLPSLPSGTGQWVREDGTTAPLTRTLPTSREVRYEGDGLLVTLTSSTTGTDSGRGLVADSNGEVSCLVCAFLASGGVIEAWVFSDPRLAAAWRVDDTDLFLAGLPCQRFTIPLGAPLDGRGSIPAGVHTLQLQLPTASGTQVLNVGVTIGQLTPTSVRAGEGAGTDTVPLRVLPILAGVMLIALVGVGRRRSQAIS